MSAAAFTNLLALVLGLDAAVFFCFGSALLTRGAIADLAGTYWNENRHLATFLSATKAEYFCGGVALFATFCIQFVAGVPGVMPNRELFARTSTGVIAALCAGVVTFFGLLALRTYLRRRLNPRVQYEKSVP